MMTTATKIINAGAMNQFIAAFAVASKLTGQRYQCRFSHMWNAIATRHADTIDCKFFVDGRNAVVGLAHTAFIEFQEKRGRSLTDREASYMAAQYLAERLAEEDERALYDVSHGEVQQLIEKLSIR